MAQRQTREHYSQVTHTHRARLQQIKPSTELTKSHSAKDLLLRAKKEVLKLDLGGGHNPQAGFITLDIRPLPHVHIIHDWNKFPWPIPNETFTIILAGHVVEHVPPHDFGFIKFMNECWRVMKYDGQLMISTPYAGSLGYNSDPTHCNPCTHMTWAFFDPLHPGNLWNIYQPKPWKFEQKNLAWQPDGNMEVMLIKRREDIKSKSEHSIYDTAHKTNGKSKHSR